MEGHSKDLVVEDSNATADGMQQRLTDYACQLSYDAIPEDVIHTAKIRIIDTLGALIGGFSAEPCVMARSLVGESSHASGATMLGTRTKTAPDAAAFVNASTARNVELTDIYHVPGSQPGHPSDVIAPVLVAAECAGSNGKDFLAGVVLGYEIYLQLCDRVQKRDFDNTQFACLGATMAAGRLWGLPPSQMSHCIAMAVVANNILHQVREGHLTMFKSVAAGCAARNAIFSAQMARAGIEGPHLPFEGRAGWLDHVAKRRFAFDTLGGEGVPFRILSTSIKIRPSMGETISAILAAEKVAPIKNPGDVKEVVLETYRKAKASTGTGRHHWNPESRETADHSAPYVVAAALIDGTIRPSSFDDAHLRDPRLRELMQKVSVVENENFTKLNERTPVEHHAHITVVMNDGRRMVGTTGGGADDVSAPRSDAEIEEKFRGLAEESLGTERVTRILDWLFHLESHDCMAALPPLLVMR